MLSQLCTVNFSYGNPVRVKCFATPFLNMAGRTKPSREIRRCNHEEEHILINLVTDKKYIWYIKHNLHLNKKKLSNNSRNYLICSNLVVYLLQQKSNK